MVASALVGATALGSRDAHGQPAEGTEGVAIGKGEDDAAAVLVVPDDPSSDLDDRALGMIRAHVDEAPDQLRAHRPSFAGSLRELIAAASVLSEAEHARGVVWVELGQAGQMSVYVYEARSELLYGRRISTRFGDAAALEEVANVASSALVALIEGHVTDLPDVEVIEPINLPAPEPEPEPEPELEPSYAIAVDGTVVPRGRPVLRLRVEYVGNTFAPQDVWQNGASLGLGGYPIEDFHLELGYELITSSIVSVDGTVLRVRRHPVYLSLGYRFALGNVWGIELGARGGVDPVTRVATAPAGAEVSGPSLRLFTHAGPFAGVSARFADHVLLRLGVGMDVALSRARYAVYNPDRILALDPAPVRFVVRAGFVFDLIER